MINKKLQNQQPKEIIRLDYQNGLYQGQHNGYHKDGFGCFCSDDGLFYIGLITFFHFSHSLQKIRPMES